MLLHGRFNKAESCDDDDDDDNNNNDDDEALSLSYTQTPIEAVP